MRVYSRKRVSGGQDGGSRPATCPGGGPTDRISPSGGDTARRDGMDLILTNDDGVEAPGLGALRRAVEGLGRAWVVAPAAPTSGCGHAVTTHQPIRTVRRDEGCWAVDGTPADCVRLALHHLVRD